MGGSLYHTNHDAHFRKLLLQLGVGDKARQGKGQGGSYGYGKSVYASNSDIACVIYYSVFEPTAESENVHARAMGCAYFQDHVFKEKSYTGRAWLGVPDQVERHAINPFVDDAAHKLAQNIGLTPRSKDQAGLTISIIGTHIDLDVLRDGIETFWWPRIHDRELEVEIWDGEERCDPPRPLRRDDLKSFIHCYDIAKGVSEPIGERQDKRRLRSIDSLKSGVLVTEAIDQGEDYDPEENDSPFLNTLALIRNSKMIIEYRSVAFPYGDPLNSVFVADNELDNTLMLSEPPAHNQWDPNSDRLDDAGRKIVKTLLDRLRTNVRNFQRQLTQSVTAADVRVRELERQLGRVLKAVEKPAPPPPPPPGADPIEVHLSEERSQNRLGEAFVTGEIKVKLRQDAEQSNDTAKLRVKLDVLANDNQSVDGPIPLLISSDDEAFRVIDESSATATVEINREQHVIINVQSDPFDSDWASRIAVSVEQANE